MSHSLIESLIVQLSRLPGLGPKSAERIVAHLVAHKETQFMALSQALSTACEHVQTCKQCFNIDDDYLCHICADETRDQDTLCILETISDLWALERSGAFRGIYHVLGGTLSAIHKKGPDALHLNTLLQRLDTNNITEVIIATNATVDGRLTAHYLADLLADRPLSITYLGLGVPVGGELNYLDDGTLQAAFKGRRSFEL
jgi:recombination protein RecR